MSGVLSIDPYGPFAGQQGFWTRQFAPQQTRKQLIFDMIFGVHGPVLCFLADPIVFKSGLLLTGLYSDYQLFVYLVAALQVPLLSIWLLYGAKFRSVGLLMGGALMAGAFFSFCIGVLILPFSLLGLLWLIGVFGFTPFLTAFVYLRNSVRAIRAQPKGLNLLSGFVVATIAAVYVIGLPAIASIGTARIATVWATEVMYADEETAETAAHRLSWLPVVPDKDLNELFWAYERESDPVRRALLAQRYREITGGEISQRRHLVD